MILMTDLTYLKWRLSNMTLKELKIGKINIPEVISMNDFCGKCCSLKEVEIELINPKNLKNINGLFQHCKSLKKAKIISKHFKSKFRKYNENKMKENEYLKEHIKLLKGENFKENLKKEKNNQSNHSQDC